MKTEYCIIEGYSVNKVIQKIKEKAAEGFECQGGITISIFCFIFKYYCQSMIRKTR